MTTPLKIALIGGSGLGQALAAEAATTHEPETPFGKPSSPIRTMTLGGVEIAILLRHGEGHTISPTAVPYRANIFALKQLGVTHILASGATGSLREEIRPRDLVITDQIIDKTYRRANTFYEKAAVHVELSKPFCPVMRQWLLKAAQQLTDLTIHEKGTYVCMEGPAFSTEAESHMHRIWGGDLIGMTAMPEARLAREAEIAYAQIAMPTDYDCWRPHPTDKPQHELLQEIIGHLQVATANSIQLIKTALADTTLLTQTPSPAHTALALGIWSDKKLIDPAEIKRLAPLWGRYFE